MRPSVQSTQKGSKCVDEQILAIVKQRRGRPEGERPASEKHICDLSSLMQTLLGERLPTEPSDVHLSRSLEDSGLKLAPKTSALDFVVIDAIEPPSSGAENRADTVEWS